MEVEPEIIRDYIATGKVRLIYRHLLQLGEESELIAEASECAADQQKFWEMRSTLYAALTQLYTDTEVTLSQLAQDLGLNLEQYNNCMSNQTHQAKVRADFNAATAEGIRSRPVFRIGEEILVGSRPYPTFQSALDAALSSTP